MHRETLSLAVPEGINEYFVVLNGNWAHRSSKVKGSFLEHDTIFIVDTCPLRKYEQWCCAFAPDVFPHLLIDNSTVCCLRENNTRQEQEAEMQE